MPSTYPPATRQDLVDHLHGQPVPDPYRWLEELGSDTARTWAERQDALFAEHRDSWPERDAWDRQLTAAAANERVSAPVWRGRRCFTERHLHGREQTLLYLTEPDGGERVVVDPHAETSESVRGRTRLALWRPSWEGDLVACQFALDGADTTRLRVRQAGDGSPVGEPIDGLRHSPVAWLPGGKAFYYVGPAADSPPGRLRLRVKLHRLGRPASEDEEVFGAQIDGFAYFGLTIAPDGSRLAVSAVRGISSANDLWLAALAPDPARLDWRKIVDGTATDSLASIRLHRDGGARLHTDRAAPRGRILTSDPDPDPDPGPGPGPTPVNWRELLPHHPEDSIDDSILLDGPELPTPLLLVLWSRAATSRITLHSAADGSYMEDVPLPGSGTVRVMRARPEGGHEAWFTYTDFGTPPTVFRFDALTRRVSHWPEGGPSPYGTGATPDRPALVTRQVRYRAGDGTAVLMFLLTRDTPELPAGPRPTLLTAYGGFGTPMRPAHTPAARAWAEAGGVYAVACVRGGGEHGNAWHAAGRGAAKSRAVDDFNDAAQWLFTQGWTTSRKLAAAGTSNGGLLVTAAMTRHPDRYAAVAATGPLCDMARYERFGIGHTWVEEYGSAAVPHQLGALLAYSPYHRVRPGTRYPAVLLCGADTDERTGAQHVRKMCAALQHATAGTGPVLMRRTRTGGHGHTSASSAHALTVDTTAFLAHHTGLKAPPSTRPGTR